MVPLLSRIFGTILEWYHFRFIFSVHVSNGTIFVSYFFALCSNGTIFWFSKFFTLYSNGTFFVAEFCNFSIAFLFVIFCTFNECYHFFAHFSIGTLFVTKFSHFSQMVPFLFYFFRTLLK